jgi:SAM-dependent methyltransferase
MIRALSASVRAALTPARTRGTEYLDARDADPAVALRSLTDIRRANGLFGGRNAVLAALRPTLASCGRSTVTLLDVGTGAGDIPAAARRVASGMGIQLLTSGLEWSQPLAAAARAGCGPAVVGDARRLPLADRSVDIVCCSQLLHHFAGADAEVVVRELHRVARMRVIVGEIRRSWLAAAGLWLASWPLGFHPVSRHDGVVSVFRGFVCGELAELVRSATGVVPEVADRPGFRVTASWSPA